MGWLTIKDEQLVFMCDVASDGQHKPVVLENLTHLLLLTKNDHHVMYSSSLDFPHEYTSDQKVIEMCKQIRG